MKEFRDLESDAARRLFLDLKIAFWDSAKHSVEENQRIVRSLRKKYDTQYGEGASERDLGLKPFLELSEVVQKQVEFLEEQPMQEQVPAGFESWFRPTSSKKRYLDYFYALASPILGGEEITPQADTKLTLLAECQRLYLIDARSNPKAAEEYATIASMDDILTYLSCFPNAFDAGYGPGDPLTVAAI